jgi:hypothetical protein
MIDSIGLILPRFVYQGNALTAPLAPYTNLVTL